MDLTNALPTNFLRTANSLFDLMQVTEEEIAQAKQRYSPNQWPLLWDSFTILCPTATIHGKSEELYRHHCRELIDRLLLGGYLNHPTTAELLGAFVEGSLQIPMNGIATYAYFRLFLRVHPNHPQLSPIARKHMAAHETTHGNPYIEEQADILIDKIGQDVAQALPDRQALMNAKLACRALQGANGRDPSLEPRRAEFLRESDALETIAT